MSDKEEVKLAKCGMDCTACRFAAENNCPGCMYCLSSESEGSKPLFDDEDCDVGRCCVSKGFGHCGRCPDFPCDILREVSFDKETGDGGNRLMVLKSLRDGEENRKRMIFTRLFSGCCAGLFLGIIIGCLKGEVAPWIFAGLVSGGGTGAMIAVAKGK